jgi:hypothetical protein
MPDKISDTARITPDTPIARDLQKVADTPGWTVGEDDHQVTNPDGEYRNLRVALSVADPAARRRQVRNLLTKLGWKDPTAASSRAQAAATTVSYINPNRNAMAAGGGDDETIIDTDMARRMLADNEQALKEIAALSDDEWDRIVAARPPQTPEPPKRNRPTSRNHMERYVKPLMLAGEWLPGQSMTISGGYNLDGRVVGKNMILDGGHRLLALAELDDDGHPTKISVKLDTDGNPYYFVAHDSGKKRDGSDNRYAIGKSPSPQTAALARACGLLLCGADGTHWNGKGTRMSTVLQNRIEGLVLHQYDYDAISGKMSSIRNRVKSKPNVTAMGILYIFSTIAWPKTPIDDFYEALASVELASADPVIARTREYFVGLDNKERKKPGAPVAVVQLDILTRAYRAWCRKEPYKPAWRKPAKPADYKIPAPYRPSQPKGETMQDLIQWKFPNWLEKINNAEAPT